MIGYPINYNRMRQSELFCFTRKETPKEEQSINAQLLLRGGYIDKVMAGVYTLLPLGLRVVRKIETVVREEMNAIGGQEILMPALQPRANWEQTGRWETLDVLYKLPDDDVAFGPTHEEIVAPLAKQFIHSYKDLPKAVYQIQTKFRNEPRAKSGLLRGREFIMKDLYSFHRTEADLDLYYDTVTAAYRRVFDRLGIGDATYFTYASGGTFSKYSHEFQTVTAAGEDTIHCHEQQRLAINQEIKADVEQIPELADQKLTERTACEVGNIFKLNTKFSTPFKVTYADEQGKEQAVIMGCYGIGITRLMGVLVELFHDDRGICWPKAVAPYAVHILSLAGENTAVANQADAVYTALQQAGIEVLYDDRAGVSAGEKFATSDLLGLPVRLVISAKSGDRVEYKERTSTDTTMLTVAEAIARVTTI